MTELREREIAAALNTLKRYGWKPKVGIFVSDKTMYKVVSEFGMEYCLVDYDIEDMYGAFMVPGETDGTFDRAWLHKDETQINPEYLTRVWASKEEEEEEDDD